MHFLLTVFGMNIHYIPRYLELNKNFSHKKDTTWKNFNNTWSK